MDIQELYNRYINSSEIDLSEKLSIDEFKERLKDKTFNDKWGEKPESSSNFMYNWIRSKSGK